MGAPVMESWEIGLSNGFEFCLTETGPAGKRGVMIVMKKHLKSTGFLSDFYSAILTAGFYALNVLAVPSGTFKEENPDQIDRVSDPLPTFRIERPSPGAQTATIVPYIFLTLICAFGA